MGDLKVVYVDIENVIPYENNPRINDDAVEKVANSIREFGWQQPIVVDKHNVIIVGHTRLKAAQMLGEKQVPVVFADLSEERAKSYRLADNKTGQIADWDFELLEQELDELSEMELDFDMSDFGFDIEEENEAQQEITEDEVPEPPKEPVCKVGDIWKLGEHRLICGDCTDTAVVSRLMDGEKAEMLFTSPPYSDIREYNGGKDLTVENIARFIPAFREYVNYQCVNLGIQRKENDIVQYWDEYIRSAKQSGYKLMAWNVWDKMECGSVGQQSAFFPIRHEWIFVFGTEYYKTNLTQKKRTKPITRKESTTRRQKDGTLKTSTKGDQSGEYKRMESVISLTPVKTHTIDHPAPFPVELPAEYIKAMSNKGDGVIEPFGGSGSTLIACEQLERKCYICELDETYCDVIIQRWENFTGRKAEKIG